jgi:hypothetical protein
MIPGANLLNMAFRIIAQENVVYYRDLGRIQNIIGQDVTEYDPGTKMSGSFQPVPRNLYTVYGLDFQKSYYTFYTSNNLLDLARNISGDQIAFNGQRYQCESANDWFMIDGWKGVLCIHIGNDNADQQVWGFSSKNNPNTYLNFGNGNFLGGNE